MRSTLASTDSRPCGIAGLIGVKGRPRQKQHPAWRAARVPQRPGAALAQTLHRRSRLLGRVGRCGCSGQCRGHRGRGSGLGPRCWQGRRSRRCSCGQRHPAGPNCRDGRRRRTCEGNARRSRTRDRTRRVGGSQVCGGSNGGKLVAGFAGAGGSTLGAAISCGTAGSEGIVRSLSTEIGLSGVALERRARGLSGAAAGCTCGPGEESCLSTK